MLRDAALEYPHLAGGPKKFGELASRHLPAWEPAYTQMFRSRLRLANSVDTKDTLTECPSVLSSKRFKHRIAAGNMLFCRS